MADVNEMVAMLEAAFHRLSISEQHAVRILAELARREKIASSWLTVGRCRDDSGDVITARLGEVAGLLRRAAALLAGCKGKDAETEAGRTSFLAGMRNELSTQEKRTT